MHSVNILLMYIFLCLGFIHLCIAHTFIPADLRCENQISPVGTSDTPTFSWKFQTTTGPNKEMEGRNSAQTSYQVVVQRAKDGKIMWDTGCVSSRVNYQLTYKGKKLASHTKYNWKVRVWDQSNEVTPWSATSSFSTSILYGGWTASWISTATGSISTGNIFRKEFSVPNKPIYQALVSVAGLGLYELFLDGKKVGDDEIRNGFTNYNKTVLISTYDITPSLRSSLDSPHCFGVMLGNGMYNTFQVNGRYTKFVNSFGPRTLFLQLTVEYTDGSVATVVSDATWKATQGPLTFTSIYGGEDYNAMLEEEGWDAPNFNDSAWTAATIYSGPTGVLIPFDTPPVKVKEILPTQNITQLSATTFLYDLGHNFAGWPHITVKGEAGAVVTLTPAEVLNDGEAYQQNSGSPMFFTYTLKGGQVEEWHPRFSYYGLRWVQVNLTGQVAIINMEGHFIHADLEVVGSFISSNTLFNQIHEIILTSYKSNLQSIFHDCPHREKLGWEEQAHLLAKSVAYNFDISKLFAKSVRDMYEAQTDGGLIPDIAPEYTVFPGPYRDAPNWGSTYILVPYFLYKQYGDIGTLSTYYESMLSYLGHLTANSVNNIVGYGLGDWCDIILYPSVNWNPNPKLTPVNFTSTSVYYEDIITLNASAAALGLSQYVSQLTSMAQSVKQSYNDAFLNSDSITYSTNSQTANAMALYLGLNDPSNTASLVDALVANVRGQNNHTTCGEIGHVYLLRALASNGRSDVVYDIHSLTDLAGYGYMLSQGATSLGETWNWELGVSHNHAMFGHIEEWFYEYLGGIQFSLNNIKISPAILPEMNFVNATYKSIFGHIGTSWYKDTATSLLHMEVEAPVNSRVTVTIPSVGGQVWESGVEVEEWHAKGVIKIVERTSNACKVEIGSGAYHFTSRL